MGKKLSIAYGELAHLLFPLETNIAHKNGWLELEDEISYWGGLCSGAMLVLGRVYNLFIVPFFCRFGPPIVEIEKVHQNLTDVSWNKKSEAVWTQVVDGEMSQ